MSVIFSDEELIKIEPLLGTEFIELYQKLWSERSGVKKYYDHILKAINSTSGYTKMYWQYKLQEVISVLKNQSQWLRKVIEHLKNKISDEMYSKLEDYLDKNDPFYMEESVNGEIQV